MTILKNDEVQALAHAYFLEEAGRPKDTTEQFLAHVEHRSPSKGRDYVSNLMRVGFIRETEEEGERRRKLIALTAEGRDWFERNVEGWRACNQYVARPKFDDPSSVQQPRRTMDERLRDPIVPIAAAAGALAALFLSSVLR
jgi:hypothetical protein